jgi:hypothetical protein
VTSTLGAGSEFIVRIPPHTGDVAESAVSAEHLALADDADHGKQRISA